MNNEEGKAVQPIIYEPTRIDPFKVVSLLLTVVTITLSGAGIYWGLKSGQDKNASDLTALSATVDTMRQFSLTRAALADANSADTKAKLDAVANLPYRVGVLESSFSEMARKQEQLNQTLLNTVDAIRKDIASSNDRLQKDVNGLSTQVQVLDSKVTDLKSSATAPLRPRPTTLEYRPN